MTILNANLRFKRHLANNARSSFATGYIWPYTRTTSAKDVIYYIKIGSNGSMESAITMA